MMHSLNAGPTGALSKSALVLILGLTVIACVPPRGGPGPRPNQGAAGDGIGVLETSGPQVYVNSRLAASGAVIHNRDHIVTGAASSARVNFNTGGFVQLSENTDPVVEQLWSGVRCVTSILLGKGDIYAATDPCDCVFQSSDVNATCSSTFAASAGAQGTRITLVDGHMSIRRPAPTELRPFEQIAIANGRIAARRLLPAAEVRNVTAWRNRYRFEPVRPVPIAPIE